jgi:hypothetical protein
MIYVASSWRNPAQPLVIARLWAEGHEVFDFRNDVVTLSAHYTTLSRSSVFAATARRWNVVTHAFWFFRAAAALTWKPGGLRVVSDQ